MARISLKWGSLKSWDVGDNQDAQAALQEYFEAGKVAMSAAMQRDNDAQKIALCKLVDAVDEPIQNDWSGETMTKDEAKSYIMEYH